MKKVQGNDSFQRINYLYQISKLTAAKYSPLSAYYGNLITSVAKKNVLKIHPDIKRQICKKCRCMLREKTSTFKIKTRNNNKFIEYKCNTCGTIKRFPVKKNKDYRIWVEKQEAIVELIMS